MSDSGRAWCRAIDRAPAGPVLLAAVLACCTLCAPGVAWATSTSAYVANYNTNGAGGISQYDIGAGGELTAKATPTVAGGNGPFPIAISPDGKSVYVANFNTNGAGGISEYDVGAGDVLTPKGSPTVAAGNTPAAVAISPDGKSVYVANQGVNGAGGVSQYDVGAGGELSPKATPTVAAGNSPDSIAISPDGRSVYVTNQNANGPDGVSEYDVGAGGELTPKLTPTVAAGNGPNGIAISPDGRSVYVTNFNTNGAGGISEYDVGAGGQLTPKAAPTVAAGNGPFPIAVSPNGKSVYVANQNANGADAISEYSVGADGELTPKATPTVAAGSGPYYAIAVSPDGKSVYVANFNTNGAGGISEYDVGAGGELSPKATPTVAAGNGPNGIAVVPDQGPTASFSDAAAPAGSASSFDGSASSDFDGTVVRYDWNFGDGTTLANGGAHSTHTYTTPGTYTVTLTVTDDAGCSTTIVFTGQTAYCNGSAAATETHTITVPSAAAPASPRAPVVTTGAATGVRVSSATVAGAVNPEGSATNYHLQYGTSTHYGKSTATHSAGSGTNAVNVSAHLTGLRPGAVYHYRVVATNAGGTRSGADRTFQTKAAIAIAGVSRVACTRASRAALRVRVTSFLHGRTTVRLDGRRIAHGPHAALRVRLSLSRIGAGRHTITVTTTSRAGTTTRRVHFSVCAARRPAFTG
jgi:DNA-binding beta-propeller fold protein YncE